MIFKDAVKDLRTKHNEFDCVDVIVWLNDYVLYSGLLYEIINVYGTMLDFVELEQCYYDYDIESYDIELNVHSFKEVFSIG